MLFLFVIVLSIILSLVEALFVWWIGPLTGISYFDTATYWNVFFLVAIGNMIAGGSSAASK